jgi:hypothetical protein
MCRIVTDLKRNHVLLAFNSRNVGSLFYLTIIRCHLTPLLHRSCGLSAEWAALVQQPSREEMEAGSYLIDFRLLHLET